MTDFKVFDIYVIWMIICIVNLFCFFISCKHIPDAGTYGENQLYRLLKKIFKKDNIFRNLYLENEGNTTEIDIVAINEKGVFVFENKHYQGNIYGDIRERYWKQVYKDYNTRIFYNPVKQNNTHCKVIKQLCPEVPIYSFVTFSGKAKIHIVDRIEENILYLSEVIKTINNIQETTILDEKHQTILKEELKKTSNCFK